MKQLTLFLIGIITILLGVTLCEAQVQFGPNVIVENEADATCTPALVRDPAGVYYAVWSDWRLGSINWTVFFSRSTDGGLTWLSPHPQVSDLTPVGMMDLVRDSSGYLYCLWTNGWETHLSRSTDNGDHWSLPSIPVSDHTAGSMETPQLCLGNGGRVYATWSDASQGWGIWFSRSTDYGLTWSPNIRVSSAWGFFSDLVRYGNVLHLVYGGDGLGSVYYTRSTDEGSTWSSERAISGGGYRHIAPSLTVSPQGNLYVLWMDERNGSGQWDVYTSRSTDGGATWLTPSLRVNDTTYSQPAPADPYGCLVCDESGRLHAAWMDGRDGGNYAIYYSQSTDQGDTWLSPNVEITNDTTRAGAFYPYLSVDPQGDHLAALWMDARQGYRIFFARGEPVGVEENDGLKPFVGKGVLRILAQNPGRGGLSLKYLLPGSGQAKVEIYDVCGRKLEGIPLGSASGPGWHELRRPLSLPSGVYYLKLVQGRESAVTRFVLLR